MSIVKMKRLHLVASASERERLMKLLAFYGVVELTETEVGDLPVSEVSTDSEKIRASLSGIVSAKDFLKVKGKMKMGLLSKKPEISEKDIFSSKYVPDALSEAEKINFAREEISRLNDKKAKLEASAKSMEPWEGLDMPLDLPQGKHYSALLLTAPVAASFDALVEVVAKESEVAELFEISKDGTLRYMLLLTHKSDFEKVFSSLKQYGVASVKFHGLDKTAKERRCELLSEVSETEKKISEFTDELKVSRDTFKLILTAEDALRARLACEVESEKGVATEHLFYIEGWAPKREEKNLTEFFEQNGCAYEFSDPAEGEEPPTLTYNSAIVSPFNVVTNMYSAPAYTGIDPNPMMAPFFALFFGIMLSDAGYGLLLMMAGTFALLYMKPKGGFKSFMQLAIICGASTVLWGLLFGGIFGNGIQSIYQLSTGKAFPYDLALWFDPSQDPMKMLIFSMALGGVQIIAGMAVKAYMLIRDGEIFAAIFDIGSWWVVFAGAITCIFNTKVGLYILIAGAAMLILTQGRAKKNILMKFFSGVLSLYDVTGYFSDILSYSRLLALSLSTAVVSQVVNTMGVITGPIGFVIVFIIGHLFNIAINLIGSFVHSARLQYVEYFGKFYEGGGRLFAPLAIKTKNTNIIKEEN